MAINDIFRKVPVEIPNKSGFDMSHENLFTTKVGTLTPCMVDLLLPNDTISLGVGSEIQLPPMATDFYGRVKAHFEAFFVPCRLLYGGWQEIITHPVPGANYPSGSNARQQSKYLPTLSTAGANVLTGSLADFLGFKYRGTPGTGNVTIKNPLRFAAYHKIYDDWYRDSRIQSPVFEQQANINSTATVQSFSSLPSCVHPGTVPITLSGDATKCADGVYFYQMRQRNFARDYFTNCTPKPQAGDPAALAFTVNTTTGDGSFTIQSLRAANSLQQWMERNNVAGYRYGDQIRAQFGVYPEDAILDRSIYLGRQIVDVYNKSVYQTGASTTTQNPFKTTGAKFGSPLGVGSGELVDNFTAKEHGYIFVMFSLVPDAVYSTGVNREFGYNSMADFPFPLLAGIGDQEINLGELYVPVPVVDPLAQGVFGYTQRYANHKFMNDEVHGLMVDGESLAPFALQRSFSGSAPQLGSAFIQIPTNYLDGVSATSASVSTYGCWVDSHFNYRKVSTLPAYSVPTLGDMKNTHTEVIPNGGTRL